MAVAIWKPKALGNVELLSGQHIQVATDQHFHAEYQIGIVQNGTLALSQGRQHYLAMPQSVFIFAPGEVHSAQSVQDTGWNCQLLFVDPAFLAQVAIERTGSEREQPRLRLLNNLNTPLLLSFAKLFAAIQTEQSLLEQQTFLRLSLAQLLTHCSDDVAPPHRIGSEHRYMRQAQEYLHASYTDNVSLDQLAAIAGLSRFHFVRVFHQAFGLPPHAYLTQVRIIRAQELLAQGWQPARVASAVGFANTSHLTRHLLRTRSFKPGEYARAIRRP